MADIEKKRKELLFDLDEDMDWNSGLREYSDVDAVDMTELPDYVKECLEEELAKYISDENNYVVEGAIVECDHMSKQPVQMYYTNGKLGIKGEGGSAEIEYKIPQYGVSLPCFELDPNETEIRAFHAINANQDANGLRFATISDRSCLRDKIEKENMEEGKDVANLISMGNCKIMLDSDVLEINKRKGKAKIFGTCYCLMKPVTQWENPYCMESLVESNDKKLADVNYCYLDEHHHTMNWDTGAGQKEGLTRLSTLLCTRGGIITFTWSGQTVAVSTKEEAIKIIEQWKAKENITIEEVYNAIEILKIYMSSSEILEHITVAERLWIDLRNYGYSEVVAAAILGNAHTESGGIHLGSLQNGGSEPQKGYGAGLFQWAEPTRQQGLLDMAEEMGVKWDNYELQFAYLIKEIEEKKAFADVRKENLNVIEDIDVAAETFCNIYEGAGKPNMSDRKKNARDYYTDFCTNDISEE